MKTMKMVPVRGYPGYHICTDGLVYVEDKINPHKMKSVVPTYFDTQGFPHVQIGNDEGVARFSVRYLVASHLLPPIPYGHVLSSRNGNRADVSVENLVYRKPDKPQAETLKVKA